VEIGSTEQRSKSMTAKPSLKERIKIIQAQSAPSLVPDRREEEKQKPEAPPEKEQEVIPQLSDVVTDKKKALQISALVAQLGALNAQIAPLNKVKKTLTEKVKVWAGQLQIGKALAGEWKINYFSAPRATLNEDMLIAALLKRGTQPKEIHAIVAESTKTSDGYTLRVTAADAEDEGE